MICFGQAKRRWQQKQPQGYRELGKSEEKSVKFSRQMISDIFFLSRNLKSNTLRKNSFTQKKDIIGFQIDAMRKGERKARRNRERKMNRSSLDGKVSASRDKDDDDISSKSKKSHKSCEKKRSKDPSATGATVLKR
jgi:hypothetical protein